MKVYKYLKKYNFIKEKINDLKKYSFIEKGKLIMIKADYYLKRDIQNILEYGYKDENPRPKYKDGTPAYTISVNHVTRTYDLSKGEFPICTLRPQAWKTAYKTSIIF